MRVWCAAVPLRIVGYLVGARGTAGRVLLTGGAAPLVVVAASVLVQRLLLPLAAIDLESRVLAVAALLGASLLGFVRSRAADAVGRVIRMNVLELYLGPFERGPAPALPSPRS